MTSPTLMETTFRSLLLVKPRRAPVQVSVPVGDEGVCAAGVGKRRLVCHVGFMESGGTSPQVGLEPRNSELVCGGAAASSQVLCPGCRLFLVHADGSGVEFLPSQVVEEDLLLARSDPAVALLKEPLPDSPGALFLHTRLLATPESADGCVPLQTSLVSPF